MPRFRGEVEQARRDLRNMGFSQSKARESAPRLAELRESQQDQQARPYSWLGGKAATDGETWDD